MSLVIDRLNEHYNFAKQNYNEENIIGIFLAGSQNYGTDTETSDVDTKMLITPTLSSIYQNKRGDSKTLKMPDSNEQISIKDIRCAFSELKKQNINLLEILFTDYCIINQPYKEFWQKLIEKRDLIARYDALQAIKTTKGMALNYYDRLFQEDGKVSPKHTANLIRLEYYLKQYIDQKSYLECLRPEGETLDLIKQIRNDQLGQSSLVTIADAAATNIKTIADAYIQRPDLPSPNKEVEDILNDICKEIIDTSFFAEYARNGEI